jgi:hypothetical protein
LRIACEWHATSKRRQHRGYGLYLLREVVARNGGTFSLSSGGSTLRSFYGGKATQDAEYSHGRWQGTAVSVVIDLGRSLPIRPVYAAMPVPEGFEEEDFLLD